MYELAPTTTDIPPPSTFEPREVEFEERRETLDVDDDAVQWFNVLFDKV
jgi:hypothetical protein